MAEYIERTEELMLAMNADVGEKTVVKSNYCPNCGAKMDLEGENGT